MAVVQRRVRKHTGEAMLKRWIFQQYVRITTEDHQYCDIGKVVTFGLAEDDKIKGDYCR